MTEFENPYDDRSVFRRWVFTSTTSDKIDLRFRNATEVRFVIQGEGRRTSTARHWSGPGNIVVVPPDATHHHDPDEAVLLGMSTRSVLEASLPYRTEQSVRCSDTPLTPRQGV